jgi:hypothetical protein
MPATSTGVAGGARCASSSFAANPVVGALSTRPRDHFHGSVARLWPTGRAMSRRRLLGRHAGFVSAVLVAAGCGNTSASRAGRGASDDGGTTRTRDATTATDGATADVPSLTHTADAAPCGCRDLHTVIDCSGNPVATCSSTQGCSGGVCIDACKAAAATKSSVGCEYYDFGPVPDSAQTRCFAMFLANTWTTPVTVSVDLAGTSYDPAGFARIPSGRERRSPMPPSLAGRFQQARSRFSSWAGRRPRA